MESEIIYMEFQRMCMKLVMYKMRKYYILGFMYLCGRISYEVSPCFLHH